MGVHIAPVGVALEPAEIFFATSSARTCSGHCKDVAWVLLAVHWSLWFGLPLPFYDKRKPRRSLNRKDANSRSLDGSELVLRLSQMIHTADSYACHSSGRATL